MKLTITSSRNGSVSDGLVSRVKVLKSCEVFGIWSRYRPKSQRLLIRNSEEFNVERNTGAKTNNSLKLLIVDDDQSALDLVGETLSGLGFELHQAHNAAEAFAYIQQNNARLALVVSDFNMPDETGFDLRKKMLPDLGDIPFVLLSGFVSREDALRAIDLKISAF